MAKKVNEFVMTKAFRTGLTAVYADALAKVGVKLTDDQIKPHLNSSATVTLTDAQLETVRAANLPNFNELSAHGNNGNVTIVLQAGIDYLLKNRPTLTEEERAAKKAGKGTGPNVGTKEEQEKRRAARESLNANLFNAYGIRFGVQPDADDSDGDDEAESEE